MEKKSLCRGIEDIADIFISQKKENVPTRSSATVNARKAVGESAHEHSYKRSEERMSSHEDGNVSTIDERIKVTRNYLSSEHPLKHNPTERNDAPGIKSIENSSKDRPDACEIEEHVTSIKKIGYLNTPDVQENIVKSLSQHLRRNYNIKKIELAKVSEVSRPGMENLTEKNILIYVFD
jgi:hypothetical protein